MRPIGRNAGTVFTRQTEKATLESSRLWDVDVGVRRSRDMRVVQEHREAHLKKRIQTFLVTSKPTSDSCCVE
jgi:hypothetical protein